MKEEPRSSPRLSCSVLVPRCKMVFAMALKGRIRLDSCPRAVLLAVELVAKVTSVRAEAMMDPTCHLHDEATVKRVFGWPKCSHSTLLDLTPSQKRTPTRARQAAPSVHRQQ
jgi:hypothetical protein